MNSNFQWWTNLIIEANDHILAATKMSLSPNIQTETMRGQAKKIWALKIDFNVSAAQPKD